eukprot:1158950-Pelagomonas_calceolata.AAC.3
MAQRACNQQRTRACSWLVLPEPQCSVPPAAPHHWLACWCADRDGVKHRPSSVDHTCTFASDTA